jgi:CcmD family protein
VRNFHFLLAAWMAVWAVFFVYELSIAGRVGRLRDEIERLKRQLKDG